MSQWIARDYACPKCGLFEAIVDRPAPSTAACECGELAERVITGTHAKTVWGAPATRAKSDPRPGPGTFDTSAIADGMDVRDWKAKRKALWHDRQRAEWKAKTG